MKESFDVLTAERSDKGGEKRMGRTRKILDPNGWPDQEGGLSRRRH